LYVIISIFEEGNLPNDLAEHLDVTSFGKELRDR